MTSIICDNDNQNKERLSLHVLCLNSESSTVTIVRYCLDRMQQPQVRQLLGNARYDQCPIENPQQLRPSESGDRNPFSFTPQLIHLHKDHEMFEDGDIHRHMYLQDLYTSDKDDKPALSVAEFACHISGCSAVFSSLEEYEHHYNSLHRHVCSSCRRSLPSARLLDIHIQEWHDSLFTILAQNQDMYQCLVEGCGQKFRTSKDRKAHLIGIHKYPPDFRFDKSRKDKGGRETKKQLHKDAAMEVVPDVCKSEGVCEVLCEVLTDQPEKEESMEMHVSEEDVAHMGQCASAGEPADVSAAAHGCTGMEPQKPRYSYRVPTTVCFGHGSVRGFRGRRGRRK
ncbi:zinc finger protein 511 [Betta splendens]|uniref:Zinc finger protein 511 n=1 Tax=Betta splendens TaxID=158456 RepID=A0A6P7KJF6_BETSP|nr:zinc finger protein 511 [Betta splendens]